MSTLTAPTRAHTPEPTPAEIDAVDAGLNTTLADAAHEPLSDDPLVAAMQADRDRCAARGDFDTADTLHRAVQDMRECQARADQIDLDEREVEL